MHILIIPSFYPTEDNGVNGVFFKEQAEGLALVGNKIGIIYPELRSIKKISISQIRKNYFQRSIYIENNVNIIRRHCWNIVPTKFLLGNKLWVRANLGLFELYIEKYGVPDIIHAHCALWSGEVARVIKKKYGIPYVITEHSTAFARGDIKEKYKKYIYDIYNDSEKLIAVSGKFANILKEYRKDIEVVYNMVDCEYFSKNIRTNKDKVFKIFTVCFLNNKKGVDILIKAFAKAFRDTDNIKLVIGGDGPMKKELVKLAEDEGIRDKVEFLGLLNRAEVRAGFEEANYFVLPSYVETFGVVFIEAMSMGIPVIGSICGGPEEFITKDVGELIEVGDINELARKMSEMRNNIDKYDFNNIRNYVTSKFDKKVICNKLQYIYKEVLEKRTK